MCVKTGALACKYFMITVEEVLALGLTYGFFKKKGIFEEIECCRATT